jgi:hypothetical protein
MVQQSLTDVLSTNELSMIFVFIIAQSSSLSIYWQGYWAHSCDFINNDLTNAYIPGEDCSKRCAQTSGCTHYTWNQSNSGTCWMKYGSISKSDAFATTNTIMVCGIVPSINWTGDWAYGCDFNNSDLINVQISDANCSEKCTETLGCTHFTWNTYNGGTCWMKYGSISKNDAFVTFDSTFICGVVSNQSSSSQFSGTTSRMK